MLAAAALVACGEVSSTPPIDAPAADSTVEVDASIDAPIDAPTDAPNFTVTVEKTGGGDGTITSTPAGINCGAMCVAAFSPGTTVTLTAAATAGSTFLGWTGGTCSGTAPCNVTGDATVTAQFAPNNGLVVALAGTGSGQVVSTPAGIDCGLDCMEAYAPGTMVTLLAATIGDSRFVGWSGSCVGTGACMLTLTSDTTVNAAFALNSSLIVTKTGTGDGHGHLGARRHRLRCRLRRSLHPRHDRHAHRGRDRRLDVRRLVGRRLHGHRRLHDHAQPPRSSVTATYTLNQFPLTVARSRRWHSAPSRRARRHQLRR
jgi:hypothetical protein